MFILLSLVLLDNIFKIFGRRYLFLNNGINRQKNNTLRSQKNLFRIMFCLQRVVYAGMNTKDQRENVKQGKIS